MGGDCQEDAKELLAMRDWRLITDKRDGRRREHGKTGRDTAE